MTREEAALAKYSQLAVYTPDGTEVVVKATTQSFPSVVVEYNSGERDVFRLDELTASRELLAVMED